MQKKKENPLLAAGETGCHSNELLPSPLMLWLLNELPPVYPSSSSISPAHLPGFSLKNLLSRESLTPAPAPPQGQSTCLCDGTVFTWLTVGRVQGKEPSHPL